MTTSRNARNAAQKTPGRICHRLVSPSDINSSPRERLRAGAAAARRLTAQAVPDAPGRSSLVKPFPDLIGRTIKLIREQRIIVDGDRVLIACSGGIDSATLLFVLNEVRRKTNFDLGIAHVNHRLRRGESDRDEAFVRDAAKGYGLPFFLKKADVKEYAASHGLSLQHAGRDIRYLFLNEVADNAGFTRIAMAHNLDDQIETFLLRLIKGTGLRGLSSIPPVRDRIIRPFLGIYRSEIVSFAEQNSIPFVL